jgi:hypothetical protein
MGIKVRDFDDILKKDYNKNAVKEVFVDDIKDKLFSYYEEGYPMGEAFYIVLVVIHKVVNLRY